MKKRNFSGIYEICKRICVLLLLVLFLFNTIGFYLTFFSIQNQHRTEQFKYISENKSTEKSILLKFPAAEKLHKTLFSKVNEREIRFQGKMYDIVKKESKNDSLYFYVIQDNIEEDLLDWLDEHLAENALDDNKLPKKGAKHDVLKNFLKDYIPSSSGITFFTQNFDFKFGEKTDIYLSAIISLPDNPPEVFKV